MAVNYVNEQSDKAVIFAYDIHPRFQEKLLPVKIQGLDADKMYKVEEINLMPDAKPTVKAHGKVFSGDYLMKIGLDLFSTGSMQSRVVELTAQP